MHRRAGSAWLTRFVVSLVALFTLGGSPTALASNEEPVDRPPVTVSEFIPDQTNLSDCVGLVEKPGCGSEARGGAGQTAVFIALVLGLGLVIWRISVGVRANRAR
ncbi:hypothetical protein YM304_35260 [Ilumatobacter coccineus YM16-304]|jgi:hypothetical protein|uniref:Uncharacterized protein n=1 Tax=Ilumatobacter coccineus (strain NBRC 103263 / KCTC 29153 / YM16-304) TaxID=1313172 RepID=A0A6C7EBT3_ILUCY|nr:hypothetical protein YM304_35260 [Ilumatobacter coccineus YM16-304]